MAVVMPAAKQAFFRADGTPLVGGRLRTFAAGTSTPKATFSDAAGTVPNTNPITLDARGEALIYWSGAYKVQLEDADGTVIWTVDNYLAPDATGTASDGRAVLPSNAVVEIASQPMRAVDITGTTPIQSFGLALDGAWRIIRFLGSMQLQHNPVSLILPGGANITTQPNDVAIAVSLGSSNWQVYLYERANGLRIDAAGNVTTVGSLTLGGRLNGAARQDVPSAPTVDLTAVPTNYPRITGTTGINAITLPQGGWAEVLFEGALTLSSGANFILPTGANITTAPGDSMLVIGEAGPSSRVLSYRRANGLPLAPSVLPARVDVASAATLNLQGQACRYVRITGTTPINSVILADGNEVNGLFEGSLTIGHGASLQLPTGASIVTASGDTVTFRGEPSGVVRVTDYLRANGVPLSDTGAVQAFMRASAPAGWIKANGQTIGSAASGATGRANADTFALYSLLWTEFSNTVLPIQNSSGGADTRGASAAADFAANKRLPVFDLRAEFLRGWDDGRGVDSARGLGTAQTQDIQSHTHSASTGSGGTFIYGNSVGGSANPTGTSGATGGTETRPRNVAVLWCIKL